MSEATKSLSFSKYIYWIKKCYISSVLPCHWFLIGLKNYGSLRGPYLIPIEYINKYLDYKCRIYWYNWHFYMDWYPQAPLTAFQACRRLFVLLKDNMFVRNLFFVIFVDVQGFYVFLKTPNRRETHSIYKIVGFRPELSSRPDWWPKRCPLFANIYCVHLEYLVLYPIAIKQQSNDNPIAVQ